METDIRLASFHTDIEVVATANDPFDARDKIIKYEPDVMTCDIEMPKMNGIEFIRRLMPQYPLPGNIPGIVIVQHIPPVFLRMFAERLNNSTQLQVREARTGDYAENGRVLIAPGDGHMRIRKTGGRFKVEVFQGDKVNGHCPSVDVLFESVAKECGSNSIGIILTGMGYDGAKGLLSMRKNGASTIGQDEKSSVAYGMPKVAYNIGAVERQVSLDSIPQQIFSLLR